MTLQNGLLILGLILAVYLVGCQWAKSGQNDSDPSISTIPEVSKPPSPKTAELIVSLINCESKDYGHDCTFKINEISGKGMGTPPMTVDQEYLVVWSNNISSEEDPELLEPGMMLETTIRYITASNSKHEWSIIKIARQEK